MTLHSLVIDDFVSHKKVIFGVNFLSHVNKRKTRNIISSIVTAVGIVNMQTNHEENFHPNEGPGFIQWRGIEGGREGGREGGPAERKKSS